MSRRARLTDISIRSQLSVKDPRKTAVLPVSLPKCMIGFKESRQPLEQMRCFASRADDEADARCLCSAQAHRSINALYDDNVISDSFGHEYNSSEDYAFSVLGGETKDPDELLRRLREAIENTKVVGLTKEAFERTKRKKIGGYFRMLNSPEAIASEFTRYRFRGADLFRLSAGL